MTESDDVRQSNSADFTVALQVGRGLVRALQANGVQLRLFGSVAVFAFSGDLADWLSTNRRRPRDIDAVARKLNRRDVRRVMGEIGYALDDELALATEGRIYVFRAPGRLDVEVRFDVLEFAHIVPVGESLSRDGITVALTDLLLSKLGIVELNQTDICDLIVLMHALDGCNDDRGVQADLGSLAKFLSSHWGFWYTATRNLRFAESALEQFAGTLTGEERGRIRNAIGHLLSDLTLSPKSIQWRLRALIGARLRWFTVVSERERTF